MKYLLPPIKDINELLSEIKHWEENGAAITIYAENLSTGETWSHQEAKIMGTASVIKLPIAMALWKKALDGKVNLKEQIKLKKKELWDMGARGSGIIGTFPDDTPVSLELLCGLMLSLSDNAATTLILKKISMDEVNAFLKTLGFENTKLTFPEISAKLLEDKENCFGQSTAKEMAEILKGLANNRYFPEADSKILLDMMNPLGNVCRIHRYLPTEANRVSGKEKIKYFRAKSGCFHERNSTMNDLAYFEECNGDRFIMSIFTQGIHSDDPELSNVSIDHPSRIFIGRAAECIHRMLRRS